MQETRPWTATSRTLARWSTVVIVALLVAACSNPPAASPSAAPVASTPASEAPASSAPASAAANQYKIGYISLGDSVPFVKLVSDGIREAADAAGQELLFCDSEIDAAKALACAQNLKVQGAEGVLNFQVFQDSSPEICTAYGSVPTIAIDIVQPPCQIAFMGANNREAGRLGGAEMGKYAKENWDCDFTAYVSLESTAAGAANTDRMGGWRDGFKESCPIPADKERILDGADRTDPALEQMTNLLGALPGDRIIVVGDQRGRDPRRDRRREHARSPDRPLLRRPGHRSLHLEGRRLQPELHRLGGVLPGALRDPAHPEHDQGARWRDHPRGDLHRARRRQQGQHPDHLPGNAGLLMSRVTIEPAA